MQARALTCKHMHTHERTCMHTNILTHVCAHAHAHNFLILLFTHLYACGCLCICLGVLAETRRWSQIPQVGITGSCQLLHKNSGNQPGLLDKQEVFLTSEPFIPQLPLEVLSNIQFCGKVASFSQAMKRWTGQSGAGGRVNSAQLSEIQVGKAKDWSVVVNRKHGRSVTD